MIYSFDTRIRFSEIDENGFLRFDNFINYFQDCSTFQSEDLGLGVEYLRKMERVWVVSFWQVDINKYPRLGDKVTVGTFAYDFKSFLGYRNFFMRMKTVSILQRRTVYGRCLIRKQDVLVRHQLRKWHSTELRNGLIWTISHVKSQFLMM